MTAIDFARAAGLFMGTDKELALALGISVDDVRDLAKHPNRASRDLMKRFGDVLIERGKAMIRVGEMLKSDE